MYVLRPTKNVHIYYSENERSYETHYYLSIHRLTGLFCNNIYPINIEIQCDVQSKILNIGVMSCSMMMMMIFE